MDKPLPVRPVTVFISSTFIDNEERRKLVEDAILRAKMLPVGMERFTASAHPVVEECERLARECDVFLGIIAHRYGWIPVGSEISITEREYDAAKAANRPRLMFELAPSVPVFPDKDFDPGPDRWPKQAKLEAFKAKYLQDQLPARFEENKLSGMVVQALLDCGSHRQSSNPLKPDLTAAARHYLDYVQDKHQHLNFKGMGIFDKIPLKLPLLELYVPLKARLELPPDDKARDGAWTLAGRKPEAEEAERLRLGEPQPVLDLLRAQDGLVILGDPGAGKTTFLKYLALQLAAGQPAGLGLGERLPILVPLSGYANALEEHDIRLDDYIARFFHQLGGDWPVQDLLTDALERGTGLVLLDGLDEVARVELRHLVVERVCDFYLAHKRGGNKFVITSRIIGYKEVRPTAQGLAECTLVDFNDAEIAEFVERWTLALETQAQGDTGTARADAQAERLGLLAAVQHNPGVRQLAANPLLLTILALMKRQGVTLPERRVELYAAYVNTLLSSWNRVRGLGRPPSRDLDPVQTMKVLAPLALWMHRANPGVGLVKREDLRRELEAIYQTRGETEVDLKARQFIQDLRHHAGLLLERGPGEFGFIHLTFEEYLSAVALALAHQGDGKAIALALLPTIGEPAWREVARLTVGYVGFIQQMDKVADDILLNLVANPAITHTDDQRNIPPFDKGGLGGISSHATGLADESSAPVLSPQALEKGRAQNSSPLYQRGARGDFLAPPPEAVILAGEALSDCWPNGVTQASRDCVIPALMQTLQATATPANLRRRAGLILGKLGWLPEDLDCFIEVPPGRFLYGENRQKREIHERYWIAQYPVTNHQYARFIQAGGYQQRAFWTQTGWDWLENNNIQRPGYWDKLELSNPLCPVVGVSWFEAIAYARWLDVTLKQSQTGLPTAQGGIPIPKGYAIELPTETAWERAARGEKGQDYPWRGAFDPHYANVAEADWKSLTGGTTAVCTYPQGISPVAAWDLAGNVWEWCLNNYSQPEDCGLEGEARRVLRGGSWRYPRGGARASYCGTTSIQAPAASISVSVWLVCFPMLVDLCPLALCSLFAFAFALGPRSGFSIFFSRGIYGLAPSAK